MPKARGKKKDDKGQLNMWTNGSVTGELQTFCLACRAAYNSFVLYHNFRHAVDVLQSTFSMLLHIGVLPPYTYSSSIPRVSNPAMASLLTPFDVLTLLISAIGHDVGHPGVNNRFLVELNSPLAQLYNDNSVLEAFHCAAFSQILRRHWPAAFKDATLRRLLISTILATDMCLHFDYLKRLKELQQKYQENNTTNRWNPSDTETYRTLLCGLLIKCADISNVVSEVTC
jgi:3'5'-cyclic nucleotide phosphodiesterase family protein